VVRASVVVATVSSSSGVEIVVTPAPLDRGRRCADHVAVADGERRGVDDLLAAARGRIERADPETAWAASRSGGALIVDIRSDDDRRRDGIVPGSLHVPRTVLEWRADPESAWASPHVGDRSRRLLILCDHGFSSSLAAATLVDLGFARAGDVVGGFQAWRAAGLPVAQAPSRDDGRLPGMGPPD
jgi:rhodanese-related sulfurtransferase